MVPAIKMAARVAALITLGAAIAVLFGVVVNILAGAVGIGAITQYIGVAKSVIDHWTMGVGSWLIGVAGTLFLIEAAIQVFKFVTMGYRFITKVSEG